LSISVIKLKPIGYVRRMSKMGDVRDRSLVSRIVLRRGLLKALDGLEDFSHVLVLFYMHQVSGRESRVLKVHPRGRVDLPLVGVFATRTAFRPNPIGLTVVELLRVEENVLVVRGLDAFDGTPVLDVKPYDSWDMVLEAKVPEWHRKLHREACF